MWPVRKRYWRFSRGSLPSRMPMTFGAEARSSTRWRTAIRTLTPGSARTVTGPAIAARAESRSMPAPASTAGAVASRVRNAGGPNALCEGLRVTTPDWRPAITVQMESGIGLMPTIAAACSRATCRARGVGPRSMSRNTTLPAIATESIAAPGAGVPVTKTAGPAIWSGGGPPPRSRTSLPSRQVAGLVRHSARRHGPRVRAWLDLQALRRRGPRARLHAPLLPARPVLQRERRLVVPGEVQAALGDVRRSLFRALCLGSGHPDLAPDQSGGVAQSRGPGGDGHLRYQDLL